MIPSVATACTVIHLYRTAVDSIQALLEPRVLRKHRKVRDNASYQNMTSDRDAPNRATHRPRMTTHHTEQV